MSIGFHQCLLPNGKLQTEALIGRLALQARPVTTPSRDTAFILKGRSRLGEEEGVCGRNVRTADALGLA